MTRLWVAELSISRRTAQKIAQVHGITEDELRDAVECVRGLYGRWDDDPERGRRAAPHAVALMIQVPWDRTNQKLPVRVELITDDGQPVSMPGPTGPQPLVSQVELEVGRPAGIAPGSTLSAVFAVNVAPMSLSPGRYEWRASVDGQSQGESFQGDGVLSYSVVRPLQQPDRGPLAR